MPTTLTEISTTDGACKLEVVTPTGAGPWPAVILFFDAGGLRPSQTRIAERISESGYIVVTPDLFHRAPPLSTLVGGEITLATVMKIFADAELRAKFMQGWYGPALDYANLRTTIGAVLDFLGTHSGVTGKVGTTGYCMGGNASFRTATIFGDRIAATAAFHPGGLVTAAPDSPHTRATTIKSRVYLGPAIGDLSPEQETQLRATLDEGHVTYTIEHYAANHGYAFDDGGSYDVAAAERHYAALEQLLRATL